MFIIPTWDTCILGIDGYANSYYSICDLCREIIYIKISLLLMYDISDNAYKPLDEDELYMHAIWLIVNHIIIDIKKK
jgi:hypothetical protein